MGDLKRSNSGGGKIVLNSSVTRKNSQGKVKPTAILKIIY